jgi:hypothetical protein
MKTRDEVITQLRRLQPDLRRRYPVRELGIFGSYARGFEQGASVKFRRFGECRIARLVLAACDRVRRGELAA